MIYLKISLVSLLWLSFLLLLLLPFLFLFLLFFPFLPFLLLDLFFLLLHLLLQPLDLLRLLSFLGLQLKFLSKCSFPSFQPTTIGQLLSGMTTSIAPPKIFIVPTTPNRQMIIDDHIFFISTSDNLVSSHIAVNYFLLVLFNFRNSVSFVDIIAAHDLAKTA